MRIKLQHTRHGQMGAPGFTLGRETRPPGPSGCAFFSPPGAPRGAPVPHGASIYAKYRLRDEKQGNPTAHHTAHDSAAVVGRDGPLPHPPAHRDAHL